MKRRISMLVLALVMAAGASVASAGHSHFGRMAFVHHVSPSHMGR